MRLDNEKSLVTSLILIFLGGFIAWFELNDLPATTTALNQNTAYGALFILALSLMLIGIGTAILILWFIAANETPRD